MLKEYYLIIGKANAGKTTYARKKLEEYMFVGKAAVILDGDNIRHIYENKDFSGEGRVANINTVLKLAKQYMKLGVVPIIAMVCPKRSYRRYIEKELGSTGKLVYIEGGVLWEGTNFEEPKEDTKHTKIPDWRKLGIREII